MSEQNNIIDKDFYLNQRDTIEYHWTDGKINTAIGPVPRAKNRVQEQVITSIKDTDTQVLYQPRGGERSCRPGISFRIRSGQRVWGPWETPLSLGGSPRRTKCQQKKVRPRANPTFIIDREGPFV